MNSKRLDNCSSTILPLSLSFIVRLFLQSDGALNLANTALSSHLVFVRSFFPSAWSNVNELFNHNPRTPEATHIVGDLFSKASAILLSIGNRSVSHTCVRCVVEIVFVVGYCDNSAIVYIHRSADRPQRQTDWLQSLASPRSYLFNREREKTSFSLSYGSSTYIVHKRFHRRERHIHSEMMFHYCCRLRELHIDCFRSNDRSLKKKKKKNESSMMLIVRDTYWCGRGLVLFSCILVALIRTEQCSHSAGEAPLCHKASAVDKERWDCSRQSHWGAFPRNPLAVHPTITKILE